MIINFYTYAKDLSIDLNFEQRLVFFLIKTLG